MMVVTPFLSFSRSENVNRDEPQAVFELLGSQI